MTSSFDQDVGMDLASVDIHELRPDEQDAVRSLILEGLREHWGSVDPALNPDLDDLATTYATAGSWSRLMMELRSAPAP